MLPYTLKPKNLKVFFVRTGSSLVPPKCTILIQSLLQGITQSSSKTLTKMLKLISFMVESKSINSAMDILTPSFLSLELSLHLLVVSLTTHIYPSLALIFLNTWKMKTLLSYLRS
jgi:hypothetical protein